MQVLSAELGYERGQSGEKDSEEASGAAENVAQGQATQAKSMGEAVKDFLTTPQVAPSQAQLLSLCFAWLTPSAFAVQTFVLQDAMLHQSMLQGMWYICSACMLLSGLWSHVMRWLHWCLQARYAINA